MEGPAVSQFFLGPTIPATATPSNSLERALWREGVTVALMCGATEFDALVTGHMALAAYRKHRDCADVRSQVEQAYHCDIEWEDDMDFKGRLSTVEAARAFVLAGNATITLVSKKTGARFTYKVRRAKPDDDQRGPVCMYFVSVLTGVDNEDDFSYLGFIRSEDVSATQRRGYFHGGRKAKLTTMAPSHMAFAWFWGKLAAQGVLPEELEVWHEGRCGRCGRKLTVPSSIASGFGPDCMDLVGGAQGGLF